MAAVGRAERTGDGGTERGAVVKFGFLTIYWRDMLRFFRFRTLLVSSLVQPALWLAFFGIAMSSNFDRFSASLPLPPDANVVSYLTFLCAGVIAMTTLFTSLYGGIVFLFDKNWGLMREILASPLPRESIIVGVGLSGMTKSFIQAGIIACIGILLGVRFFAGYTVPELITGVIGLFAFVAAFSLGFLFLSSAIAISMESPEGLQGIITLLTMPIFFASNALYPIDAFPEVLRMFSAGNPLTHMVTGIRYFAIGGDFYALGVHYTYTVQEVATSFGILVFFAALMFLLAWWRFRKAVAT
ncbi:MAG: ABC transporter permease [Methanomicrobiales archaeon]|nr:ABC transporter permease [Methanomicrobiales archaeon]